MTESWDELCQAEALAYFKGDMVLDSPESYTVEEMWEVVMEMLETTIAVQDAMHEDFMSYTPEERQALLDACVGSGTAIEEWWKNTLLGYVEIPDSNRMHQKKGFEPFGRSCRCAQRHSIRTTRTSISSCPCSSCRFSSSSCCAQRT